MAGDYLSFETERLILRPTTADDADFILALLNSPKWLKNIGDRGVYSKDDALHYIKDKITSQLIKKGFTNNTVIRKEDGVKLGSCGLYDRPGMEGVDIGFAFLPEHEKKGYAYEAAKRIMEAAEHNFKIKKVKAITIEENVASRKLLEKLGLEFTAIITLTGDDEELMLYEKNFG